MVEGEGGIARGKVGTYRWELVADEDLAADALGDDAAGEDEVVESERSCPCARNCYEGGQWVSST
jgi:hypothetical protein